jgi:putative ABC transport system substrate-binding protein
MRRRKFITLLGGAAAWPLAARAQQPDRVRRIGVLMTTSVSDPDAQPRVKAFERQLQELGWIVGRNLQIEYRWGMGDLLKTQVAAVELLRLNPDVLLSNGSPPLRALQQVTRTVPIVFVLVTEPVAQGFVASLASPGGNITGFTNLEPTIGGKWLELLKEIAPGVARAAVLFSRDNSGSRLFSASAEAAAKTFAMSAVTIPVNGPAEIEAAIMTLGRAAGGGLILPPDTFMTVNHKLIIDLATRHRLPAIYARRFFATEGGLLSYGLDVLHQYRQAAAYVDRILRGDKASDLPVQQPTKYELVINLKTAKALGLTVPPTLLARADEVIE